MKIIGESKTGFIIEATKTDIANLIGYYWLGNEGCPKLKTGDEIQISKMYRQLEGLSSQPKNIESVIATLKHTIDILTIVSPVLEDITKESKDVSLP